MNDFILDAYSPSEDCKSFKFKKGITTAVYLEGVNQAYLLAKDLNDEKRMTCYGNFIPQAADHLISLQVQESDSVQAIGGFKGSKTSHSIRVDNNQHAIMALMDAYEHGLLK